MSRQGIASPGGYVSYDPKSQLDEALGSVRQFTEKVSARVSSAASRISDRRPAGAMIQVDHALKSVNRALLYQGRAKILHLRRHPGDWPERSGGDDSMPLTDNLSALIAVAMRFAHVGEVCALRAHNVQMDCCGDPSASKVVRVRASIEESGDKLRKLQRVLERIKALLETNPAASSALRFRRQYQGPVPMRLRSFD